MTPDAVGHAGRSGVAVEVSGLRFGYGGSALFDGLELSLPGGGMTGLIGANGSGKTTLLKLISGVGPKIEGTLHELGIFTYAQVAAWKKAEREWVDGYLNFKGRIERDDWVKQAKALAKGGEAEYIRVFGKKPR